jgi:hypothetical protein
MSKYNGTRFVMEKGKYKFVVFAGPFDPSIVPKAPEKLDQASFSTFFSVLMIHL